MKTTFLSLSGSSGYRHTLFYWHFAVLHFSDAVFFTNKARGNPASGKFIRAISPPAFAHFVSLTFW